MISLSGKRGLIVGIANEHSIAYGCACTAHEAGAELFVTYLNDKAKPFVEPLAKSLEAKSFLPLDVRNKEQLDAVFADIAKTGGLDFLIHSIAFAPWADLHSRLVDCSEEGFVTAMTISCYSFIQLAHRAEPLMTKGGSLLTMSYYGADKVILNYAVMGPVKAALELATRYMAAELGSKGIRVNAISPGPIATRAASGLPDFDKLMALASTRAPLQHLVDLNDVGALAAFLVSDLSKSITGGVHYVDGGYEILG